MTIYDGEELRAIRKALEMTQQAFADALKVSRPTINLMENGNRPITEYLSLKAKRLADDALPTDVSVAPFGTKFVLIESGRSGRRLAYNVLKPAYSDRASAVVAGKKMAEKKLANFNA